MSLSPLFRRIPLPSISRKGYTPLYRTNVRSFSQFPARWARPTNVPSTKTTIKEGIAKGLGYDFGMLPDTFIINNRKLPSVFTAPIMRTKLTYLKWKAKATDLARCETTMDYGAAVSFAASQEHFKAGANVGTSANSLVYYKWTMKVKPPIKILRSNREVKPTALDLHKKMYTAIAEGNLSTLSRISLPGLLQSQATRIASRSKNLKYRWRLVKYHGRPHIVSHRAAQLPYEGGGLRQVVVRIQSVQELVTLDRNDEAMPNSRKEVVATEYLVLQRKVKNHQEGEWQVWGTTEETNPDQLLKKRKENHVTK